MTGAAWPRRRRLPSLRMCFRWAKSISTSFLSFAETSYSLVAVVSRAIWRAPSLQKQRIAIPSMLSPLADPIRSESVQKLLRNSPF